MNLFDRCGPLLPRHLRTINRRGEKIAIINKGELSDGENFSEENAGHVDIKVWFAWSASNRHIPAPRTIGSDKDRPQTDR